MNSRKATASSRVNKDWNLRCYQNHTALTSTPFITTQLLVDGPCLTSMLAHEGRGLWLMLILVKSPLQYVATSNYDLTTTTL